MEITWFGYTCCALTDEATTLISNPYHRNLGGTLPEHSAQIVTVSYAAPAYNAVAAVQGDYKLVDSPGEYEIRDVFISATAIYPPNTKGADAINQRNLIFVYEIDGVTVCQPGALSQLPTQSQIEALDNIDILLVPVGGGSTLNATKASELIGLIQPAIAIPIYHALPSSVMELDPVDKFLKEMGQSQIEPKDRLRISHSNLPSETQIIVLESQAI